MTLETEKIIIIFGMNIILFIQSESHHLGTSQSLHPIRLNQTHRLNGMQGLRPRYCTFNGQPGVTVRLAEENQFRSIHSPMNCLEIGVVVVNHQIYPICLHLFRFHVPFFARHSGDKNDVIWLHFGRLPFIFVHLKHPDSDSFGHFSSAVGQKINIFWPINLCELPDGGPGSGHFMSPFPLPLPHFIGASGYQYSSYIYGYFG